MQHSEDEAIFHLGEERHQYYNAIAPAIIQSSNFAFDTIADFKSAMSREHASHIYGRGNNPTVTMLQDKIAALESTEAALVVGSGASAMSLAVMSQLSTGDHVVCIQNPYSWTYSLLVNYLSRFGITHTFVNGQVASIENAFKPNTKVLILESPNSLSYEIQDMSACAKIAKAHNVTTVLDNSLATPLSQNPSTFGIDIVIHSMSKYLNGHSDVVAGAICSSKSIIEQIFYNEYMTLGPAVSAHDASLMIRGLRTLPVRLERISASAMQVVAFMKSDERLSDVLYPFDPEFPQYDLAKTQMKFGTGLITVSVNARSIEQMQEFVNHLQLFKIAVSWGGFESLVLPIVGLYGQRGRKDPDISWRVCRFSIGLEDPRHLIDDIIQAMVKAGI